MCSPVGVVPNGLLEISIIQLASGGLTGGRFALVPREGFEPSRDYSQGILSKLGAHDKTRRNDMSQHLPRFAVVKDHSGWLHINT
jgi:hypothetical protein